MKSARELFEELGFQFKEEMNTWKNVFEEKKNSKTQIYL